VGVVLGLSACSDGFSRDEAIDAFQASDPDASTTEAACVIDSLVEIYETAPIDESDLGGLEAALLDDPQQPGFVLDQYRAMFRCGMTADVEAQLRRELTANDYDPEAADCVAGELAANLTDAELDVLIRDEMNDSFYTTFFTAVEACAALPD
jgi:hypothetical protein